MRYSETTSPSTPSSEDSPIPSGSSAAAFGLLRLASLSGEALYEREALGALRLLAPIAGRHPLAFGHALRAWPTLAPFTNGGVLMGTKVMRLRTSF